MTIKTAVLLALFAFTGLLPAHAQPSDYTDLKTRAEARFAEASFSQAHALYEQAAKLELPPADSRWVAFRLADTLWRLQSLPPKPPTPPNLENAHQQLEVLIRDLKTVEDHDRVWAEVEQSLGDYYYTRRNSQDWGAAWPHYEAALDWWAGAADIELARARYLKIVWTLTKLPTWQQWGNYYYWHVRQHAAAGISRKHAQDRPNSERQGARPFPPRHDSSQSRRRLSEERQRVPEEFEAAIQPGKTTEWFDDALFNYAEWMEGNGRIKPQTDGNWTQEPDYTKALELFRRLVKEFQKGETRYYDQAQEQQIRNLTDPVVNVSVANVFLPESEIQYFLNWRNVKQIDLTLYPVDLSRDVKMQGEDRAQ